MRRFLPPVDRRHRVLFGAMLGSFLLFGVCVTLIGAVLPRVIREFDWSYTTTGLVLSAGSVAYFVSTFCCGILIRRAGLLRHLPVRHHAGRQAVSGGPVRRRRDCRDTSP